MRERTASPDSGKTFHHGYLRTGCLRALHTDGDESELSEPSTDGSDSLGSLRDFVVSVSQDGSDFNVNDHCSGSSPEYQDGSISPVSSSTYELEIRLAHVFAALEQIQEGFELLKVALETIKNKLDSNRAYP